MGINADPQTQVQRAHFTNDQSSLPGAAQISVQLQTCRAADNWESVIYQQQQGQLVSCYSTLN